MKKLALSLLTLLIISNMANANCVCSCVNGQNIPICSNSIDLRPVCPPKVCPIAQPSVTPINTPTIPPMGTSHCKQQQVYNNFTRRYEWKQLCY